MELMGLVILIIVTISIIASFCFWGSALILAFLQIIEKQNKTITVKTLTDEIDYAINDIPLVLAIVAAKKDEKGVWYLKLENQKGIKWLIERLVNRGIVARINEKEFEENFSHAGNGYYG